MSQPIPKFTFEITQQNQLLILGRQAYDIYRHSQFKPGSKGYLVLQKFRKPRSTGAWGEKGNQNGYFHGVVLPVAAADRGYTEAELKEEYIDAFAPRITITNRVNGKTITRPMRDKEMSTVQFTEWLEKIKREEASRGCIIPDPEKVEIAE